VPADPAQAGALARAPEEPFALVLLQLPAAFGAEDQLTAQMPLRLQRLERAPLAQDRLSQLPDGRLAYRLKRPLATGTEVLILEPCELLRRLAALVPPPGA